MKRPEGATIVRLTAWATLEPQHPLGLHGLDDLVEHYVAYRTGAAGDRSVDTRACSQQARVSTLRSPAAPVR